MGVLHKTNAVRFYSLLEAELVLAKELYKYIFLFVTKL